MVERLVPEATRAAKAAFLGAKIVVLFCASQSGVKFALSRSERKVVRFVRRIVSETMYGTVNHLISVCQYISSLRNKDLGITLRQYELYLHRMVCLLGGGQPYYLSLMLYSQAGLVTCQYLV
jgi:hypothetical protein